MGLMILYYVAKKILHNISRSQYVMIEKILLSLHHGMMVAFGSEAFGKTTAYRRFESSPFRD